MTDRFTERPRPVTNKENVTIASSQALTNPHQYIRKRQHHNSNKALQRYNHFVR